MNTIVQISLDLTSIDEAVETARIAMRSGVDWLEAGTPLILAEGMNGIRALRSEFPSVMGDNLAAENMVEAAKRLEDFGCDFVIHHIGYDQRRGLQAAGKGCPSPLDQLEEVVAAVRVPVQAVGGLSIEQAISAPKLGAPLVVLGAPLTIDADSFKTAPENIESVLRLVCDRVHAYRC